MRISHVCGECGRDMARDAAPLDPIYGLPIVRCTCGTAHVRSRANLRTGWSLAREYAVLALRIGAIMQLVVAPTIGLISAGSDLWHRLITGPLSPAQVRELVADDWPVLVACGLMAALAAIVSSWLLGHLRVGTRTLAFASLLLLWSAVFLFNRVAEVRSVTPDDQLYRGPIVLGAWSLLLAACFAALTAASDAVIRLSVFRPRLSTRIAKARRKRK